MAKVIETRDSNLILFGEDFSCIQYMHLHLLAYQSHTTMELVNCDIMAYESRTTMKF